MCYRNKIDQPQTLNSCVFIKENEVTGVRDAHVQCMASCDLDPYSVCDRPVHTCILEQ